MNYGFRNVVGGKNILFMRKQIILAILALMPYVAKAQQIEYFNDLMSDMYNFAIYEPKGYDPLKSTDMPVVMFLHGRSMSIGLGGYRYGSITSIERGNDILQGQPALIVEPNAKAGEGWGSVKLHKVYEFLKAHYAFDHNRFYVIGMSMGGWGTLNYANKYPDEVAACVGIGGGCDAKTPCGLNQLPTWIIHAADDETTSVTNSDRVVEAMKKCGDTKLLKYSRLAEGGHSLIYYFDYWNLYQWLFKHSLKNRRFDTSVDFVADPQYRTNEQRYWLGGDGYEEHIAITQSELARIKARTPNSASGSGSLAAATTTPVTQTTTTAAVNSSASTANKTSADKSSATSATKTSTSTATAKTNTTTTQSVSFDQLEAMVRARLAEMRQAEADANAAASKAKANIYIAKKGDTLKKIAKNHGLTLNQLREINGYPKNKKKVEPGEEVRIKQ